MKKILLILKFLLVFLVGFSQSSTVKTYNGFVTEYRYKIHDDSSKVYTDWSPWGKADSMIILYIDWGFGTLAITNKPNSRFLLSDQITIERTDTSVTTKIQNCVDNARGTVIIYLTAHLSGIFTVRIYYLNAEMEYKIPKIEMGYPYIYFAAKEFGNDI